MSSIATTLSASKARSNFYTLLEEVEKKFKRFTITNRGEVRAVVLHPDEVASWEETMDILADKKLVGQIFQSETEKSKGKVVPEEKLFKELGISQKNLK